MNVLQDEDILLKEKVLFESILKHSLENLCENSKLKLACEYALLNGGKRFRPIIVQAIAKNFTLGPAVDLAAISVEFFHTASLIADDLPCMDNDAFRRKKPSLHIAYGETTALLASYGLISEAYHKIYEATKALKSSSKSFSNKPEYVCFLAIEIASKSSGLKGATLGQFYDLFPKEETIDHLKDVIYLKTITLFEVAFCFGWLFSGAPIENLPLVKELAFHFGLAFQIADDLKDFEEDYKNNHPFNIAIQLNKKASYELFCSQLEAFEKKIKQLNIQSKELDYMISLMQSYALASSKDI